MTVGHQNVEDWSTRYGARRRAAAATAYREAARRTTSTPERRHLVGRARRLESPG